MSFEQPSQVCDTARCTKEDSLAYLRNIIARLQVQSAVQRRVMYSCSLIAGTSVFLKSQSLLGTESLLSMPLLLIGAFVASYLAIGLAIAAVGSIVASPRLGILDRSADQICKEDTADIVDRLASLFVPITVAIMAAAILVIGTFIG